ncbi:hypothetical protein EON65_11835 [archaeon]|nr:MAG: hypothetical protein EON65_11835 [archaeon]
MFIAALSEAAMKEAQAAGRKTIKVCFQSYISCTIKLWTSLTSSMFYRSMTSSLL